VAVTIAIGVLGTIGARLDGVPVSLGGPQQRRVLAVLAISSPAVVTLDRLVDVCWPDEPPDGARRTVMTYISRVRAALGGNAVITSDAGYRLDLDVVVVDHRSFAELVEQARSAAPTHAVSLYEQADAMWGGHALGEFANEEWARPMAMRLEELHLVAHEERVENLISMGRPERAVTELEGLVVEFPLRERLVRLLMRALDDSDRRADALRAMASFRARLASETGFEPSRAAVDLEARIREGRPRRRGMARGYALGELLGEGAFGSVYLAVQPGVGREVAVKVVRSELADDPAFVRRFEAEAQLVAHLEHPHIVPLYDFWREPGGAFLVFRLLRGGNLESLMEVDRNWPIERVARLVNEVGDALAAAHSAGVVHRDVKPANVLFDEVGNAYLADFGIAIAHGGAPSHAGRSHASPYASPEQLRGEPVTERTDQYSLGTIACELLTGTLRNGQQAGSDERFADVFGSVADVLYRATAVDAAARFPSIQAFVDAFNEKARRALTSDAIGQTTEMLESTETTKAALVANPFVGLRPFMEADARHFHGRGPLIDALVEATDAPFLVIVGASGSGKSSVVHAGVVPRLRERGDRVIAMHPGTDPEAELRTALLGVATRPVDDVQLDEALRLVSHQGVGSLIVVVDQFEELWTMAGETTRDEFLERLVEASNSPAADVRIVVTVRADFYDRPLIHRRLGAVVAQSTHALTPMSTSELHAAVHAPAAAVGLQYDDGLETEIVAEAARDASNLPFLQFALWSLFERREGNRLTWSAFRSIGGLAGAVAERAEATFASLDSHEQHAAQSLMLRLVVPGDGTEDTRTRVRRRDLPADAALVADHFVRERLLVVDRDAATREPTVEFAHESLVRSWPRLRQWLDEDRDRLRRLERVARDAAAWDAASRNDSELYRGAKLEGAVDLVAAGHRLSDNEEAFVAASSAMADRQRDEERRAHRRVRRLLAATAIGLVVALIGGSIAVLQQHRAEAASQANDLRRLVSTAASLAPTRRDVAMLLAAEAWRRDQGPASLGALMSTVMVEDRFVREIRTDFDRMYWAEFSGDGQHLFALPQDSASPVRVDLATGEQTPVGVSITEHDGWLSFFGDIRELPDGRLVTLIEHIDEATGNYTGDSGDLLILDGAMMELTHTVTVPFPIMAAWPSPDGSHVLAVGLGSSAAVARHAVIDMATLQVVATMEAPGPPPDYPDPSWTWSSRPIWLDDDRLAVPGTTGLIDIVEWRSGAVERTINDGPDAPRVAKQLDLSADGRRMMAADFEGDGMMMFDVATGEEVWAEVSQYDGVPVIDDRNGVVWVRDLGGGSSRALALDLETGRPTGESLDGQHGTICGLIVSSDGGQLAMPSCNEGVVTLWSLDGDRPGRGVMTPPGWTLNNGSRDPSGTTAVFTSPDGELSMFDLASGEKLRSFDTEAWQVVRDSGGVGEAYDIGFDFDGTLLSFTPDRHLVRIDIDKGIVETFPIVFDDATSNSTFFSLNEPFQVARGNVEGVVEILDVASGRKVATVETGLGAIYGMYLSKDRSLLYAAGQEEELGVFDVETGERIDTIEHAANVAASFDEKVLATTAFDGTITFYDTATRQPTGDPVFGGTAFVFVIGFSPDDSIMFGSGLDGQLRFFDVAGRQQIGPAIDLGAIDLDMPWIDSDMHSVLAQTQFGIADITFDGPTLLDEACRAAGRNLTRGEWRQYVGGGYRTLCPQWETPPA
jgi:DNA-binding SARP family transcriptional activator/WD40 repeat protein/tRNA A-37 threonylcarbamoyl transferase component Bud32